MNIISYFLEKSTQYRFDIVEATIDVVGANGLFAVAFTIHRQGRRLVTRFRLLDKRDCPSSERAWNIGYQSAWNWLDEHAPGSRLLIRQRNKTATARKRQGRRRAA